MSVDSFLSAAVEKVEGRTAELVEKLGSSIEEYEGSQGGDVGQEELEVLRKATDFWLAFDLGSKRRELEEVSEEISKQKEERARGKRALKEREQKLTEGALGAHEVFQACKDDLDRSFKREKYAQAAIAEFQAWLHDAPDPGQALSTLVRWVSRERSKGKIEGGTGDNDNSERLRETMRQLEEARRDADHYKGLYESSQERLLELESSKEGEREREAKEIEELSSKVQHLDTRARHLEKERDELKRTLAEERNNAADWRQREIARLEGQMSKQQEEMESLRTTLEDERSSSRQRLEKAQAELESAQQTIRERDEQLSQRPEEEEVAELRRKVEAFESLMRPDESDGRGADGNEQGGDGSDEASIAALKKEIRKLEDELAKTHSQLGHETKRADEHEAKVHHLEDELRRKQEAISKLEEDVRKCSDGADGLAAAIASQRDRLQQRVSDLEQEAETLKRKASEAESYSESLRTDNAKLYERIKYTESLYEQHLEEACRADGVNAVTVDNEGVPKERVNKETRYSCGPVSVSVGTGSGVKRRGKHQLGPNSASYQDIESSYGKEFEAKVDPFAEFRERERELRAQSLKPHDRAGFILGRMLLGNGRVRILVLCYLMAVHAFAVTILYSCRRVPCTRSGPT